MRLQRLALLVLCVAASFAPCAAASALDLRHTQADNLRYELDCLAGLIRCTRDQLTLTAGVDAGEIARWRASAGAQAAALPTGPTLALPTASDLRDVSSRHVAGRVPAGPGAEAARRAMIEDLSRRTAQRWHDEVEPRLARLELGLEHTARRIELGVLLPELSALFGQGADALPTVSLIAIADTVDGSLATLGRDVAWVEAPLGEPADSRLAVIVHEFVHHWQRRMPAPQRARIVRAFLDAPGDCAVTAYHFFDEALATAIGNGIVESRLLDGASFAAYESLPDSFYADHRIDRIAKALRPRLQRQLDSRQPIGPEFVKDYVALATATLGPECRRLPSTLHAAAFVLASDELVDAQRLAQARLAPATAFVDILTEAGVATAASRHEALSGIVVATRETLYRLEPLVPEGLRQTLLQRSGEAGRLVYAWRRNAHSTLYLVVGEDAASASAALLQLVVLRPEAFTGEWLPPALPGSVPD